MHRYKNKSGNSGIALYEIGTDFIKVKFTTSPNIYLYSAADIARHHIEKMKKLAVEGKELGTYISQHPEIKNHFQIVSGS